jgi:hypothetical protein
MQAKISYAIRRLNPLYQQHFMRPISLHHAALRLYRVVIRGLHDVLYSTVHHGSLESIAKVHGDALPPSSPAASLTILFAQSQAKNGVFTSKLFGLKLPNPKEAS